MSQDQIEIPMPVDLVFATPTEKALVECLTAIATMKPGQMMCIYGAAFQCTANARFPTGPVTHEASK